MLLGWETIAVKRWFRDHHLMLSRTHISIAVALVCRAVPMVCHCPPSVHEEDVDLIDAYDDPGTGRRVIALADGFVEAADCLADALR